jgi:hypothetical protein
VPVSRCHNLPICLCWGLVVSGLILAVAHAQPQALPATVLSVEQPAVPRGYLPDGRAFQPGMPSGLVPADEDISSPSVGIFPPQPDRLMIPDPWAWQILPDGLMYKAYLAGQRESRFASMWVHDDTGWLWNTVLGGHVGLLRYGTADALLPEGWQFDLEAAAFPRLDIDRNLITADFRVGVPLTTRQGPWEGKLGYYHLCSHMADEYLTMHPGLTRLNYVRDAVVLGIALRPTLDWRLYTEVDWAFHNDDGAKPWEFQFGAEYSPARPTGCAGAPFLAVHGHIRQDVDFGGNITAQSGWQWRGQTGRLARVGAQYFNGKSDLGQFYYQHEEQIGVGLWCDY